MSDANQHLTLIDQLIQTADLLPEKLAFQSAAEQLNYSDLLQQSCHLSMCLDSLDVARQEPIGLLMPRCVEASIAAYGVMYGARIWVPVDPTSSVEYVQSVLNDCKIKVLVTHPTMMPFVRKLIEHYPLLHTVIGLETDFIEDSSVNVFSWADIKSPVSAPGAARANNDDVAYVIHTSGSTGRPKGIVHTHYSAASYARLSAETFGLVRDDVIACHGPLHTDMCTLGILAGPTVGAATHIIPDAYVKVPASLSSYIDTHKFTVWYSVPQALVQLLNAGVLEQRDLSSLRWVIYAGEALAPSRILQLIDHVPSAQICNVYGPAETNQCMHYIIKDVDELHTLVAENQQVPIGDVWAETSVLLLNENDEAVEAGVVGELVVKSSTLMKGYWHSNSSHSEIYFDDPENQQCYYRTGDLARQDDSGLYTLVGRKGRQIKVRGMRVELDSIELLLCQHPSIVNAVVIAQNTTDDPGSCVIRAVVTQKVDCDVLALLAYAKERMPSYAIPESIEIVDSIPLTSGGKVDRLKLIAQMGENQFT